MLYCSYLLVRYREVWPPRRGRRIPVRRRRRRVRGRRWPLRPKGRVHGVLEGRFWKLREKIVFCHIRYVFLPKISPSDGLSFFIFGLGGSCGRGGGLWGEGGGGGGSGLFRLLRKKNLSSASQKKYLKASIPRTCSSFSCPS